MSLILDRVGDSRDDDKSVTITIRGKEAQTQNNYQCTVRLMLL